MYPRRINDKIYKTMKNYRNLLNKDQKQRLRDYTKEIKENPRTVSNLEIRINLDPGK